MRYKAVFSNFILSKRGEILCGVLSISILLFTYYFFAHERHLLNPSDKLLPLPSQLWDAWLSVISTSEVNGAGLIIQDTYASLSRLMYSLIICTISAFILAQLMHLSLIIRALILPLVVLIAKVPPIAILPALLLWMGLGEISKIVLVILGITPNMTILLFHQLKKDHDNMKDKLHTLNLPLFQRIFIIDLPRLWPNFLHFIRLSLAPAWLFILVAERVGTDVGLGYRIFLVKRYLAMDIILIYTLWITILSILIYISIGFVVNKIDWYNHK